MVKKHGKDTFRHTKKNILHKKRVNSKKRGLRGGELNTTPKIDSDGLHGITKLVTFSREKDLTNDVCSEWFNKIHGLNTDTILKAFKPDGTLKTTITGRKDYDICSSRLNDKTIEKYKKNIEQAKKQGGKVETGINLNFTDPISTSLSNLSEVKSKVVEQERFEESKERKEEPFNTKLDTNTNQRDSEGEPLYVEGKPAYVGLTLDGCVAVRTPFRIDSKPTSHFEYNIYSPAATTEPPIGGKQEQTRIGTFTQLPVSFLLRIAGKETPFSFASFYTGERKLYFTDYIECLKNVKEKFGPDDTTDGEIKQKSKFIVSSKLRSFGKTPQCKIIFLVGNVGSQIQDPANDGAIFVIASQLNGAEYKFPAQAKKITLGDYKYDPTAGPLGQLSGHPGVAKFVLDHAARNLLNGNDFTSDFLVINAIDRVIYDLDTLGITSLTLNNGYLEVPSNLKSRKELDLTDSQNPPENATAIFDSFSTMLKVLESMGVPVSGLKPPGKYTEFNSEATTKVSLIYASAVPLKYSPQINPEKSMLQYCVAGFDLVAQYFGAMVSAYNKRKKEQSQTKVKLFLTPLGGGAFKNPREMIASSVLLAYYQAQQLFSDFDAKVEVIFLVWDGIGSDDTKMSVEDEDFSEFFNITTKESEDDSLPRRIYPTTQAEQIEGAPAGAEAQEELPALPAPEEARPAAMTGDELYKKYKSQEDFGKLEPTMSDYLKENDDINAFRSSLVTDTTKLEELQKLETELKKINKPKADDTLLGVPKPYWFETEDGKKCEELLKQVFSQLGMTYTEYDLEDSSLYINNAKKLEFLKTIFFLYTLGENPTCDTYVTECVSLYNVILEAASLVAYISLNASINAMVIQKSGNFRGGSKSRRRKRVRKNHRSHTRKSKSKSKTHHRRRHSRTRKHKKYTSRK
jgi:hypothetical protein